MKFTQSEIHQLSTWFGAAAVMRRWTHIRVAGSDARNKTYADLYCDGDNDAAQWNTAIAAVADQGGLVEGIGTFHLSDGILLNRDQVTIRGHGPGQRTTGAEDTLGGGTRFIAKPGFTGAMIRVEHPTLARCLHQVVLQAFSVDGNLEPGVTDGILYKGLRGHIEQVHAYQCQNGITIQGINGGNKTLDNFFRWIITSHNTAAGFRFYLVSPDNHLVGLVSHANQDGLLFQQSASSQQVVDVHTYGNLRNGIRIVETGARIKLTDLKCENSGEDGIYISGTDETTETLGNGPIDLMFHEIGFKNNGNSLDNTYSHIHLDTVGLTGESRPIIDRPNFSKLNFGHIGGELVNRAKHCIHVDGNHTWDGTFSGYKWQNGSWLTSPIHDDGVRTLWNGLGSNLGHPATAGKWEGYGDEGIAVRDRNTNKFYFFTDAAWYGTIQRAVTLIVATTGSGWESPDYVCDGTADAAKINQALTAANALPNGGDVLLSDGTFTLLQAVTPKTNTRLVLSKGTILKMADAQDLANLVSFFAVSNAQLAGDGILDGNKANQTAGTNAVVNISGGCSDVTVDGNLRIRNGFLRGVYIGSGGSNVKVSGVTVEDCTGQGIECNDTDVKIYNPTVRRCGSALDPHGIKITADGVDLFNPTVEDIAGKGIEFNQVKSFSLQRGYVRRCAKQGVLVTHSGVGSSAAHANASAWCKIQGLTVENCLDDGLLLNYVTGFSIQGCASNFNGAPRSASDVREGSGVLLFRCAYGSVTGNVFTSNSQGQLASAVDGRSGVRVTGDATNRPSSKLTIGHNTCVDLRTNGGFTASLVAGIDNVQTAIEVGSISGTVPLDGNFSMLIDLETVVVTNCNGGVAGIWTVVRGKTDATGDAQGVAHSAAAPITLRITQSYGVDIKDDETKITSFIVKDNIVTPNRTAGTRNATSADASRIMADNI